MRSPQPSRHRYALGVACLLALPLLGQEAAQLVPPRGGATVKSAPLGRTSDFIVAGEARYVLPPLTDAERERPLPDLTKRRRIGAVRPFPYALTGIDTRRIASGGPALLEVTSSGATRIRLHFDRFDLPEGASLTVCSRGVPGDCHGPYTARGPFDDGAFWTPPIEGETAVIELDAPPRPRLPFSIDRVSHTFDEPFRALAGSCNLTVPQDWVETAKSVGGLDFISGSDELFCTGTLLNTKIDDFTPYFLTAAHCLSSNAEAQTLRVWWRYDAAGQSLSARPHSDVAQLLATRDESSGSDYTLLMLLGELPREQLTWSGWIVDGPFGNGSSIVGIHHPNGDGDSSAAWKRFSRGLIGGTCPCALGAGIPCANYITTHWDVNGGVTEPGSSGSGIWSNDPTDPKLLGQLWGGCSACGNNNPEDHYGSFDLSYAHIGVISGSPHYLAGGRDDQLENNVDATPVDLTAGRYENLIVKWMNEDLYRVVVQPNTKVTFDATFTDAYGDIDVTARIGPTVVATSASQTNNEHLEYLNTTGSPISLLFRIYLAGGTRNLYHLTVAIGPPSAEVTITANAPTATEGGANGSALVTRGGSTAAALNVSYSLSGTAINGTDYSGLAGSVTIAAGSANATIPIIPINDTAVESNETAIITLTAGAGYSVGAPSSATVTIIDNDASAVTISANVATAQEGGANGSALVTRGGSTAAALSVNYSLSGTAINGTDYSGLTGSVTIAAGSATATIPIIPINDTAVESNETAIITLAAGAGYSVGSPASATIAIIDNDTPTVTISANAPTATEGGANGSAIVTRGGSTAAALSVNYSLTGTAINGTDYSGLTGSVTIPAGSATATIPIIPINDIAIESNETAIITLTAAAGYSVGAPSSATVTIIDNDAPTVTISANVATATEGGANGSALVTRGGSTAAALTVNYALSGTAINGTDYSGLTGSVTIAAGSATANIPIIPINDSAIESNETALLTLTAGAGYSVGSPSSATVTIIDNDAPTVTISANIPTATEGGANGSALVTRGGSTAAALTVNYALSGTAINGTDYSGLTGSATIAAGSATATIPIIPINDTAIESNETAILTLTAGAGYSVGAPSSATVTIIDNDRSTITVTASDANAIEGAGNGGRYDLQRTGSSAGTLTVFYVMGGSATNGSDYATLPGSVTFANGQTLVSIALTAAADAIADANETATLTLSANANYFVGSPSAATVTIAEAAGRRVRYDFNGDGKSDILWRDVDAARNAIWLMNGVALVSSTIIASANSAWEAAATGDFDGDGKADILWRDPVSGANVVWYMNGTAIRASYYLPSLDASWSTVGTGDVDGDGRDELLWASTSGNTSIWSFNLHQIQPQHLIFIPSGWSARTLGDFDGDGKADLGLQNLTTGQTAVWLLDGATVRASAYLATVSEGWRMRHAGDLDGDGKQDLIFRNPSSGQNAVWFMNGTAIRGSAYLPSLASGWVVTGSGDFNADGREDLLWRLAGGTETAIWLMNGAAAEGHYLPAAPSSWSVVGRR